MSRIDVMVDIETLGKGSCPPVLQIAARCFNPRTGESYKASFDETADISSLMSKIEPDTLKWWLDTNPTLFAKLVKRGTVSERQIVIDFLKWLASLGPTEDIRLWGNGVLFDNRIIKEKCDQFSFGYPVFYRNDRDVRTIVELAAMKMNMTTEAFTKLQKDLFSSTLTETAGEYHDAMTDVNFQIQMVCYAFAELGLKE